MTIFHLIVEWFKKFFTRRTEPMSYVSVGGGVGAYVGKESVTFTSTPEEPKPDDGDIFKRVYGKYRKFMKKRGLMAARPHNFMGGKHPLHSIHFGTFSPLKRIKGNTNNDRTADIHRERLRLA